MENGESLLDTLFDEESAENGLDIEMLDAEEGEFIEPRKEGEMCSDGLEHGNEDSSGKNLQHKKTRRKNRKKRGRGNAANITNINRFVSEACKRLRERKTYLMWTAVGCLGVSALSDLLKEVDAIQSCGGQKTADGSRFRKGGGILWSLIKVRDPNAYKEIMKKGKEFEKQFKQQANTKQDPKQPVDTSLQSNPSNGLKITPEEDNTQCEIPTAGQNRRSVHDRIRAPVSYDDLISGDDHNDQ